MSELKYRQVYDPAYLNVGVVSCEEHSRVLKELEWWKTRGDSAFKYLAKAHQDIKDIKLSKADNELERKELLALRMFYLATKLAAQVSADDDDSFNKAVERILYAEQKINEIQAGDTSLNVD